MKPEISKSQTVRVVDVALLGPLMIYFGVKSKGVPPALKSAMLIAGAATIAYNGRNYWLNK